MSFVSFFVQNSFKRFINDRHLSVLKVCPCFVQILNKKYETELEKPKENEELSKLYQNLMKNHHENGILPETTQNLETNRKPLQTVSYIILGLIVILLGLLIALVYIYFEEVKLIFRND